MYKGDFGERPLPRKLDYKGSERADWRRSILARAWDRPATGDASTPCRSASSFPDRVLSRLMNLSSDFDQRVVLIARDAAWSPSSAPGVERWMLDRARRSTVIACRAPTGRSPTRPVAGLARAATAGGSGRHISTGGAAAIQAEFAIIGTDRVALDSA